MDSVREIITLGISDGIYIEIQLNYYSNLQTETTNQQIQHRVSEMRRNSTYARKTENPREEAV